MLLRASSQRESFEATLSAVTAQTGDGGVPDGDLLRELTEAAIYGHWDTLATIKELAHNRIGPQATTDVLVVAAAFNGITRVADATGTPLDESTAKATHTMRADTGIAEYDYSRKTQRYALK